MNTAVKQAPTASVKKDIALELCDIRREFSISRGFSNPMPRSKPSMVCRYA